VVPEFGKPAAIPEGGGEPIGGGPREWSEEHSQRSVGCPVESTPQEPANGGWDGPQASSDSSGPHSL